MSVSNRKWWVLSVAAAGVLLATIDASIVNIALPTISEYFGTSVRITAWVTISYMLVITAFLLVFGKLSDIYGTKPIFISGMVIFTLGSVLCAVSGSIIQLILFRIFQGFGAAMIMSNTPAIVTGAFPPEQRGMGLGAIGSAVSVGLMLGPPLGGMIIHYFGWKYIFLVNIPVGVAGVILSAKILDSQKTTKTIEFPLTDSVLWIGGIVIYVLLFGISGKTGFDLYPQALFAAGAVLLISVFFVRQFKNNNHLFAPVLMKNRIFMFSSAAGFFLYMGIIGVSFMFPFFLERSIGFSPLETGRILMTVPATTVVMSPLSGTLSDRFGQRPIASAGMVILLLSIIFMFYLDSESSTLRIVLNLVGMGMGTGMFGSPNNSALMGSVDNVNRGAAAGILATVRNLGFVTGAAVVSVIFNAKLQREISPETLNYSLSFNETLPFAVGFVAMALIFSLMRKSVR